MGDGMNELRHLHRELSQFKGSLEGLPASKSSKDLQRQIMEELYDIEDAIGTCITSHMPRRKGGFLCGTGPASSLAETVKKIRKDRIPLLKSCLERFTSFEDEPDPTVAQARKLRDKIARDIAGLNDETERLVNFLISESSQLEVASIVGMAGLGKTTLAAKVFYDVNIMYEFPIRIWIRISEHHNMKQVLFNILKQILSDGMLQKVPIEELIKQDDRFLDASIEDLIKQVHDHLRDQRFFIVLDNIWIWNVWDTIKYVFPKEYNLSRVLVTTRHTDVAIHVSKEPLYLRFLNKEESWELFQYIIYGELYVVPEELVDIGMCIATKCGGFPLSIIVIANICLHKIARGYCNILNLKLEFQSVLEELDNYLVRGDKDKILSSIISLSYENLHIELRTCFFYLGVYPEDADIPVNELLLLWIAEGFIQESSGKSLEKTALDHLKELINRNLVMVKETKLNGEPKTCRIHNFIRDICIEESNYENLNLFQNIEMSMHGDFEHRGEIYICRRICIHTHVLDFLKRNKKVSHVRSFLSFPQSSMCLETIDIKHVTDGFYSLRVYNAPSIKFPEFPQKLAQLLQLRYLVLVLENCTSLPKDISKLRNLQTLIIYVSSRTLEIEADIWKMRQLRHLKTKASIILKKGEGSKGSKNLQTFSRLSPKSFTHEFVEKAKNMIVLGIQGELNELAASEELKKLYCLQKLKLVNKLPIGVGTSHLMSYPPNLKTLVLSATYLDWKKMSVLSELASLEVLKLKENAFKGAEWKSMHVFRHLTCLHIEKAEELIIWEAIADTFPRLRILVLKNCKQLEKIPKELYKNLDLLRMERVTSSAISNAKEIQNKRVNQDDEFKLEIVQTDLN